MANNIVQIADNIIDITKEVSGMDSKDMLPTDKDKANMAMSMKDEYHMFKRERHVLKRKKK